MIKKNIFIFTFISLASVLQVTCSMLPMLQFPISYKHRDPQFIGNYKPAPGPLQIGDIYDPTTKTIQRGLLMNLLAIKSNKIKLSNIHDLEYFDMQKVDKKIKLESVPPFAQDVFNFDSTLFRLEAVARQKNIFVPTELPGIRIFKTSGLNTYQYLIDSIVKAPRGNQNAIKAAAGLEMLLWQLYEYYAYYLSLPLHRYVKSITPLKGIRRPSTWLQDSPALQQILNEIEQLANIAEKHDLALAKRMKTTVHSYRNWRKYTTGTVAAGLAGAGTYVAAKSGKLPQLPSWKA